MRTALARKRAATRNVAVVGVDESERLTIVDWLGDMNFDVVDNVQFIKASDFDEAKLNELKEKDYIVIQRTPEGFEIIANVKQFRVAALTENLNEARPRFEDAIRQAL